MPHFLIKKEEIKDGFIELCDSDNLFHLSRVLRVKPPQKVKFIDNNRMVYLTEIVEVTKKSLKAKIISEHISDRVLKNNISLVQSILAPDSQNLLIANAVQTGVKRIYPVMSDNVSVSLKTLAGKVEKWNKISYENFKQCERADMAEVLEVSDIKKVLSNFKKENVLIFAEKYDNYTLDNCTNDIDKTQEIAIVIGPEGGFSDDEFQYFIKNEYKLITLGKMIYKAPNAVVAGVSNVVSRIENV